MAQTDCFTDETLLALTEKRLPPEQLPRIHAHAAECSPCRMLLAEAVRDVSTAPKDSSSSVSDSSISSVNPAVLVRQTATPAWVPPTEFDEFRLLRQLGHGGMGVVHLAHDVSLDRLVAIKFIDTKMPEEWARERFQIEARAIARLQHPNVVTLFRIGKIQEHPYLVSEYIIGQSLDALPRPLPWRRVLGIGVGLARGLVAAHRQGVLHRDLKPSNALLSRDGEVKLLDFGLAELVDAAQSRTGKRTIVGTPGYMAPEILLGASATPQSDIYALGLILKELCTTSKDADNEASTLSTLSQDAPAPRAAELSSPFPSDIDPAFVALIERCLALNPAGRYASAEALREELERLDQPSELQAVIPTGNPYRGLLAFDAEHRALFFGRNADIRAVLERLRRQSLVLVAGDSGVGKSSLCRAGILPRVAEGALGEDQTFSVVTLWPGRRPLVALAAALVPVLGKKEAYIIAALATNPSWLGQALRERCQGGRGVLLFIDHLEELLTLGEPGEAARFAEILGDLALPSPGVRVLLAVRGDYLTRLGALPGLGNEIQRALYLLRPLTPDGVREAIVGPARRSGISFEPETLVQTLVDSMAQGDGSLPLLQFALAELWEARDQARGCITLGALEAIGGVSGALSRHADGILKQLRPAEREAAQHLLVRLVTPEGTRATRSEADLAITTAPAAAATRALVEGRLLQAREADGTTVYEIAHEALIRNWGTLRNWLDEDIGQRAIRQRLEIAATEWERLDRGEELLWGVRQLGEALALDATKLAPRERAFLEGSHRRTRRRRLGRILAALPVLGGAIYGGGRLQAHYQDEVAIAHLVAQAEPMLKQGQTLADKAAQSRENAVALFDGRVTPPPEAEAWEAAELAWAKALDLRDQADAAYNNADQWIAAAQLRDPHRQEVRRRLGDLLYERFRLAERFHQTRERTEFQRRLKDLDSSWAERLNAFAEVILETVPSGAQVIIDRYVEDDNGRRQPRPTAGHDKPGLTPLSMTDLQPDSYLFHLRRPDRTEEILFPVLLKRGERYRFRVPLPASVPDGYAYIPPGCFLFGSTDPEGIRQFFRSPPIHEVCLDEGYLIGRTEVTIGDWIEYLKTLPAHAPERNVLRTKRLSSINGGVLTLWEGSDHKWRFSFFHSESKGRPDAGLELGVPFHYSDRKRNANQDWRRFPLSGVSPEEVQGYLNWLSRTGRLPGARLCKEFEWERAARGADDRPYPHGDRLHPDDANIDETYGRLPEAFGPDEVGFHRASMSPFGIDDMAGNVFEIVQPLPSTPGNSEIRGGSWYQPYAVAQVTNRQPGESSMHEVTVGVRVCATRR